MLYKHKEYELVIEMSSDIVQSTTRGHVSTSTRYDICNMVLKSYIYSTDGTRLCDNNQFRYVLAACVGCMYWLYVLAVCIGCMYFLYVLATSIGCMYWLHVLAVCIGFMYWLYVFPVCIGCMYFLYGLPLCIVRLAPLEGA